MLICEGFSEAGMAGGTMVKDTFILYVSQHLTAYSSFIEFTFDITFLTSHTR